MIKNGYVPNADDVLNALAYPVSFFYELAKNNTFENTDRMVFDVFTSSTGSKNTVDYSSFLPSNTTSFYDENNKTFNSGSLFDQTKLQNVSLITTTNQSAFDSPENAYDLDDSTSTGSSVSNGGSYSAAESAYVTFTFGKTFDQITIKYVKCYVKAHNRRNNNNGTSRGTIAIHLQYYDGSNWNDIDYYYLNSTSDEVNLSTNKIYDLNNTKIQGIRLTGQVGNTDVDEWQWSSVTIYSLLVGTLDNTSVQTNTLFTYPPKSLFVYVKNTSDYDNITVDVSDDGGQTWKLTDQPLGIIYTDALTGSDIRLRINQKTDGSQTSQIEGYGVVVLEQ